MKQLDQKLKVNPAPTEGKNKLFTGSLRGGKGVTDPGSNADLPEVMRLMEKPGSNGDEKVLKALGVPNEGILAQKQAYLNAVRFSPDSVEANHNIAVVYLHEGLSNHKLTMEQIMALDLAVEHFTKAAGISKSNGGKNTHIYEAGADFAKRERYDLGQRYASY